MRSVRAPSLVALGIVILFVPLAPVGGADHGDPCAGVVVTSSGFMEGKYGWSGSEHVYRFAIERSGVLVEWEWNDGLVEVGETQSRTFPAKGVYDLDIITEDGCIASYRIEIDPHYSIDDDSDYGSGETCIQGLEFPYLPPVPPVAINGYCQFKYFVNHLGFHDPHFDWTVYANDEIVLEESARRFYTSIGELDLEPGFYVIKICLTFDGDEYGPVLCDTMRETFVMNVDPPEPMG